MNGEVTKDGKNIGESQGYGEYLQTYRIPFSSMIRSIPLSSYVVFPLLNEPSILIPQQSWGEQSSCSVAQSNKRKPPMIN